MHKALVRLLEQVFQEEGLGNRYGGAASGAPQAGVSALDALDLSGGDTVLVVGANGGVGSFAVQLAAHAGATVIASWLARG